MNGWRSARVAVRLGIAVLAGVLVVQTPAIAAPTQTPTASQQQENQSTEKAPDLPPAKREEVLGKGWQQSSDRMWTTNGDGNGFHVLVADARTGYTWRTAATLSEPGVDVDQWIGNACVTASGKRAVVVYAPRTFTNKAPLFGRGGFTAIVDLDSGSVTKLPVRTSLAYYNPGCGFGETVALTQNGEEDLGKTGVLSLDASSAKLSARIEVPGQLTSAVTTAKGIVAADRNAVVTLDAKGERVELAKSTGVPYKIMPDDAGGVVFMDRDREADRSRVRRAAGLSGKPAVTTLAAGKIDQLAVTASASRKVFITGAAEQVTALPPSVSRLDVPKGATVSVRGEAVVTGVVNVGPADSRVPLSSTDPVPVDINAKSVKTGKAMTFSVDPGDVVTPRENPVDTGYSCAVARNDPGVQVYQPKPKQVEWAANMAVKGQLNITRPAGWKNNHLSTSYTPQGLFPPLSLLNTTGGQVPAQVMLGILGQESNLWQAKKHVYPGQTGNPLVGNYYGNDIYNASAADDWYIDFAKADCGYGVSQMTDGMRLAGREKPGETALPMNKQIAIATDYAANVAAGHQLLQKKWNEMQAAGLKVNDNNPARIENWFYATWAYNSGFHQSGEPDTAGAWGLGWFNNPANPNYDISRHAFGSDPRDFATPSKWPYPEKVIGFAAFPPSGYEAPGVVVPFFRGGQWPGNDPDLNRLRAKPPVNQFCTTDNQCDFNGSYVPNYPGGPDGKGNVIGEPAGPCAHKNGNFYDLKCWWHTSSTWKANCQVDCGREFIRYLYPDYAAEPEDGVSLPANCSGTAQLPSSTFVIDDVAKTVPTVSKASCDRAASSGTFDMTFGKNSSNQQSSKIDLHQVGGGYGAHFWFSHTNKADRPELKITGTWTLDRTVNQWARVLVHVPDHGAQTRQARYEIDLGNGQTRFRVLPQRILENKWVSLGSFPFAGTPKIRLTNVTADGSGYEDVAWDAVAVQLLSKKPTNIVVAMGDSYSSGEGASVTGGGDYYKETDIDGLREPTRENGRVVVDWRNACHRSKKAWSRVMTLADAPNTQVGQRADSLDPDADYRMVACSGAEVKNIIPSDGTRDGFNRPAEPWYGELPQLDTGWVDQDTTLVTLSIGGNDARFGPILEHCIKGVLSQCQGTTLPGDPAPLDQYEPQVITNQVRTGVETTLRKIKEKAPNAKIVLAGYPQLFRLPVPVENTCLAAGVDVFEKTWLNTMGDTMADQLALAVTNSANQGVPVKIADPRAAFAGKSVCGSPEWIHNVVIAKTPGDTNETASSQSFHPKIEGAQAYATVVTSTLRQFGL
ncbi:GDSL-type esterase/lipase family protein [Actinokineospora globicatena]|uniref:GDSL-type esterase/lipase family protein n=1 Tax=Actinokineospora globicatena TaxID=103729 RepID=UPI002555DA23|nr:GDSL-type esterase/lipase family protein [Actinokineospora globicatena]